MSVRRRAVLTLCVVLPLVALSLAAFEAREASVEVSCWILPNGRVSLFPSLFGPCSLPAHRTLLAARSSSRDVRAVRDLGDLEYIAAGAVHAGLPEVEILVEAPSGDAWHATSTRSVSAAEKRWRLLLGALLSAAVMSVPLLVLRRSTNPAAVPFALLYGTLSILIITVVAGRASSPLNVLGLAASTFGPAALTHLALTFPRVRPVVRSAPQILRIPYIAAATFFLVATLANASAPILWPVVVYLLLAVSLAAWAILLLACHFAVQESASAVERARARLLLRGALWLPLVAAPLLLPWVDLSAPDAAVGFYLAFSVLLMPLPIGLAVSRYNLFDLDLDLRHLIARLVYLAISGTALAGILFALMRLGVLEPTPGHFAAAVTLGVVFVLGIELLRSRFLGWMDQRLVPRVEALRRAEDVYAVRVRDQRDARQISALLAESTRSALDATAVSVFLREDPNGWRLAHAVGSGAVLDVDGAQLAHEALGSRAIVQRVQASDASPETSLEGLPEARVEAVAALDHRDGRLGVLLLAPSAKGMGYNSLELHFVTSAAERAAWALHHARVTSALLLAEHRAATGRTALAMAHDVGKDVGLIQSLVRRLPSRLRDHERAKRDVSMLNELADELKQTLESFVKNATRGDEPEHRSPVELIVSRAARAAERIHGPDRIIQSLEPALRGVELHVALEHVLLNLLDNALRASADAGVVHLYGTLRDRRVLLRVSDRGSGMDEATLRRAFDLGFTTRDSGGGVGLTVSREIAEGLGGEITLASEAAGGTVANLSVPA